LENVYKVVGINEYVCFDVLESEREERAGLCLRWCYCYWFERGRSIFLDFNL